MVLLVTSDSSRKIVRMDKLHKVLRFNITNRSSSMVQQRGVVWAAGVWVVSAPYHLQLSLRGGSVEPASASLAAPSTIGNGLGSYFVFPPAPRDRKGGYKLQRLIRGQNPMETPLKQDISRGPLFKDRCEHY